MRQLTVEEEDTVERALTPGALLPSIINQKDLLTLAGKKSGGRLNTAIIEIYTQVVLNNVTKSCAYKSKNNVNCSSTDQSS